MKLLSYDPEAMVLEVQMLGGRMTLTAQEACEYGRYPYHTAIELRDVLVGLGLKDIPEVPKSLNLSPAGKPKEKLTDEQAKEAAANQAAYERAMAERRKTKKVKK